VNSKEIVARLTPNGRGPAIDEDVVGTHEAIMYLSSDTVILFRYDERGWVEVDRYQRAIRRHRNVFLDLHLKKM